MALTQRQLDSLEVDIRRIPGWLKKAVCLARAALKFYKCWQKTDGSDKCVKTLIADIEKCVKGR